MTEERLASGIFVRNAISSNSPTADVYYEDAYAEGCLSLLSPDDRVYLKGWFTRLARLWPVETNVRLADIACGTGRLAEVCPADWHITGTDWSINGIRMARRRYPRHVWLVADAHKLPLRTAYFDFASCFGSLEHFASPLEALLEMKRVLKPEGMLYLELPNLFFPGYILYYYYRRHSPGTDQPLERLAGRDGWEELVRKTGFTIFDYWGRTYKRALSLKPAHRLVTWFVCSVSRNLPAHMQENHCFLLRQEATT